MPIATKLKHLSATNAVEWRTLARTLLNIYPDYYAGQGVSHSLANVTLELTYRCNWHCSFCYLKDNNLNRQLEELTYDEIVALVYDVAPYQLSFYLSGGEPFVRRDCVDIVRAIKDCGLKVGVNTNSQALNDYRIDELRDIGLDFLISSIHGPKEVHDKITGSQSFDKVVGNLRYWNSRPRTTRLLMNYVVTPETAEHMISMLEVAKESGVDAIIFQHQSFLTHKDRLKHDELWQTAFGEAPDFELSYLDYDPSALDIAELVGHIEQTRKRSKQLGVQCFFMPDLAIDDCENWYGNEFNSDKRCSYIYTNARINPCGDVIVCQFIPKVVGNVRSKRLMDIFNGEEMVRFRKGIKGAGGLFNACARCCKLYQSF